MDTPALEAGPRKLDRSVDAVPLATEDIKVNGVAAIDEVRRHQGRLDQLDHRMSAYDRVFPEPDNEGVPKPPDTQEVAEFASKQFDQLSVPNDAGITAEDVDARGAAPGLRLLIRCLGDGRHWSTHRHCPRS
jgi:hypothetical protein